MGWGGGLRAGSQRQRWRHLVKVEVFALWLCVTHRAGGFMGGRRVPVAARRAWEAEFCPPWNSRAGGVCSEGDSVGKKVSGVPQLSEEMSGSTGVRSSGGDYSRK